jgi:hypothetical protein
MHTLLECFAAMQVHTRYWSCFYYIDFWGFSQIFPDFQSSTDCGHIFNPQLCIDLTQQNANQYIHFILQELKPVPGFFCWGRGVLAHFY